MSKNARVPAFPSANEIKLGDYTTTGYPGLTKREWFAGMALCGMKAHGTGALFESEVAVIAYQYADAMIEEGSKE
jgi:hypothetical protein